MSPLTHSKTTALYGLGKSWRLGAIPLGSTRGRSAGGHPGCDRHKTGAGQSGPPVGLIGKYRGRRLTTASPVRAAGDTPISIPHVPARSAQPSVAITFRVRPCAAPTGDSEPYPTGTRCIPMGQRQPHARRNGWGPGEACVSPCAINPERRASDIRSGLFGADA